VSESKPVFEGARPKSGKERKRSITNTGREREKIN
jgi:hypothetical protein